MLQSNYKCGHRFMLHEQSGENVSLPFPCPGCRSKRSFVRESDEAARKGEALGVAPDGMVHVRATKHLELRRHKRTRSLIRASKSKVRGKV